MIPSGPHIKSTMTWETINRKVDYVPLVSTVVNLAKIIFKGAIYIHPPMEQLFQRWYITDLRSKSLKWCVLLLIPGINLMIAAYLDKDDGKKKVSNTALQSALEAIEEDANEPKDEVRNAVLETIEEDVNEPKDGVRNAVLEAADESSDMESDSPTLINPEHSS